MKVKVTPSVINGTIQAPASKSLMQRACAAALLHEGITHILHPGKSNDDIAAIQVIQAMGAVINYSTDCLTVDSSGFLKNIHDLQCGESGLGIRMFTPIAAISSQKLTISGTGSLLKRPMHFFDEIFPLLHIRISSQDGYLPIQIQGPLLPANITIDGSLSSQFLTGLLFAFGKAALTPVSIRVNNLKSKPYIDLTLEVMEHFGYKVTHQNYEVFEIHPVKKNANKIVEYDVEGDWSGAAFLLVAGAIAGTITIKGLNVFSKQADKAILQALMMAEAVISVEEKQIVVGPGKLKAFHFDATDCPDLFPPLVALAAFSAGTTVIEGVGRLVHKESNRAITLQEAFGKMGIHIQLQDDLMIIEGAPDVIKGAVIYSHDDHRIAMAAAIAGLKATGEMVIEGASAINKSYPDFYNDLRSICGELVELSIND